MASSVIDKLIGMKGLIPVFNSIKDLVAKTSGDGDYIQLPQIVVVGSQSSGKSSVLEALVGQCFFPKGSGTVTRVPIVIRLENIPEGNEMYAQFQHLPDMEFYDFQEVEQEIIDKQRELTGGSTGVANSPINLTVYSPDTLSFTVIDLPGLVKNPEKDQEADISEQIDDLVSSYISQENSIILAVCSGNVEINNAEGLSKAREVDPEAARTLAVVTKVDLAEDKEKMLKTLKGDVVHVKGGIVGVVNRSAEDIQKNKPMSEVLRNEKRIFLESYPSIAGEHGIPVLAKKLNKILAKHIAEYCPNLSIKLRNLITASKAELAKLGNEVGLDEAEKRVILVQEIEKFSKSFSAQVGGQGPSNIMEGGFSKGVVIDHIINNKLDSALSAVTPFNNLKDEELLIAIRNALPVGKRMISVEVPLHHFIKKEIRKVAPLALEILEIAQMVYQEMRAMIGNCLEENPRFPQVNSAISQVVSNLIDLKMERTKDVLETFFEIQSDSVWTANPEYFELFKTTMKEIDTVDLGQLPISFVRKNAPFTGVLEGDSEEPSPEELTGRQKALCQKMRTLAESVFMLVRRQLQDFIGKAILSVLIYQTVDNVGITLGSQLNVTDKIERIVQESEEAQEKRELLQEEIGKYQTALQLVNNLITGN